MGETESTDGLTARIAQFALARGPVLDDAGRALARRAFVDTMACAFAARREPLLPMALQAWTAGPGPARLVCGGSADLRTAAMVNATAAHVFDFDDTADGIKGHPSAVLVPLLVVESAVRDVSGLELLDAYGVGFAVDMAMGAAVEIFAHYRHGWHSTATLGVFGAVAAVGRLRGLSERELRHALAIAASMASGSNANFGTDTKPLHSGLTAANAVLAVSLAENGVTANPDQLEAKDGFLAMYGGQPNVEAALELLATPSLLTRQGLNIKQYACCSSTHPAIDLVLELRKDVAGPVERVEVFLEPHGLGPLRHHRPVTGLEAKFSMEYATAAALLDGEVTLSSFTDERVLRPQVQELVKASTAVESSLPPVGPAQWERIYSAVRLHEASGRVVEGRLDRPKGHASRPLSDDELARKVADCLSFAEDDGEGARLMAALNDLETAATTRDLYR